LNSYSITGEQLSIYVLHDESTFIRNLSCVLALKRDLHDVKSAQTSAPKTALA
jgi:hypothetical protein